MMKKNFIALLIILATLSLVGCTTTKDNTANTSTPTVITLWHYHSGLTKNMFDALVSEFNTTVGKEKGVFVDAYSRGDVNGLADSVLASANEDAGSQPMPDIFTSYPDSAYAIDKLGMVADISPYFTDEELKSFRPEFLEAGKFYDDDALKIIPLAKSTEIIYLNETDFDVFSKETNIDKSELATWEGINKLSKAYYEWTDNKTDEKDDGKAFFGIDSIANFMIVITEQAGEELYSISNGKSKFILSKEMAKTIWDNFYVPYIKGYYSSTGRFRSDDAKTGDILAYIGSSAGAGYFPSKIEVNKDNSYPITCQTFVYPVLENGKKVVVAQGAGMVLSKTDEKQQEAAILFLKWFTEEPQNSNFALSTGFLPVKNSALDSNQLSTLISKNTELTKNNGNIGSTSIYTALKTSENMLDEYTFYTGSVFEKKYEIRALLETSLLSFVKNDLEIIKTNMSKGMSKNDAIKPFLSDENFEKWYTQIMLDANTILDDN